MPLAPLHRHSIGAVSTRWWDVLLTTLEPLQVLVLLLLLPLLSAAHMVWAFSARAAHIGSYYAIKYVDPIWNGTSR
jgi:hypothetical protein